MAFVLALALLLPMLMVQGEAVSAYGMTTSDKVNIRPSIGTSDYIDRLPNGWVAKILEKEVRGSVTWYKVETVTPTFPDRKAQVGYIHGSYFRPFTAAEEASWLVSKPQIYGGSAPVVTSPGTTVTDPPSSGWVTEPPSWQAPSGYVKVVKANTNLREQPEGKILGRIPKDKILPYYGDPVIRGAYQWQYVYFEGLNDYGYIRSDCYAYTTQTGDTAPKPTPADAPTRPVLGYITITLSGTNLRTEPRDSSRIITRLDKGKVYPYYTTDSTWVAGYQWQPIYVAEVNQIGFIRSDCYTYSDDKGTPTSAPDSMNNPVPSGGQDALTTSENTRLMETPGGAIRTTLGLHTLVKDASFIMSGTGAPHYSVKYGSMTGYIHQSQIRLLTPAESRNWQLYGILPPDLQPGVTSPPVTGEGGMLRITLPGTNLRKTPGGLSLWKFDVGTLLPFSGSPTYHMGYYWAKVTDSRSGHTGYVRSDCYEIVEGGGTPVVTQPPLPTDPVTGTQGRVKLTLGGVNLRQTPGGTAIASMPKGLELPYYSAPTYHMGYYWVYVYHQPTNQYGYVRSDCYEIISALPGPGITSAPTDPPTPGVPASGYLKLIKGGVNLRNAPAGNTVAQLDRDLELAYFNVTVTSGYTWYQVDSPKGRGWVRSDVIQLITEPGGGDAPVPTTPPDSSTIGYVITIKSAINLRQAPASSRILGRVDKNLVFALTAPVANASGYNWYQVNSNGTIGYLRGDCVRQLTAAEVADYLAGTMPGTTPPPGGGTDAAGYVITTMTSVNVRESPSLDARTLGQTTTTGAVFPYESTVTAGGRTWFKIRYQGGTGYLLGSTARMMTVKEYQDWLATQPTLPPIVPTPTPNPADLSSTAVTVMAKVLLRQTPAGKTLTTIYRQGTVVALQGATQQTGSYTWYSVRAVGVNGWIRGDMLRILTKEEEKAYNQTGDPNAPPAASYRRLEIGSTGEDVRRLQQELSRLGYLRGSYVSGTYDAATRTAVMEYQRAVGLFVDGIAGNDTQHKLYNTVPDDTYNPGTGGTINPTIYPMEKVDWYSGDISTFWGKGETAVLTDVKTRLSFRVKRWSGGYHADVEPLTAEDTNVMCRVYGVSNAQQILEKNLYQRRPVWITLKGRSFAASIYGVPHNYPEGDTIPNNNFNGQFCVHFVNSKLHTSGNVDRDHQRAINEAYNAAPSRK